MQVAIVLRLVGARGFVTKTEIGEVLLQAVNTLLLRALQQEWLFAPEFESTQG